jgi:hypothetical protein
MVEFFETTSDYILGFTDDPKPLIKKIEQLEQEKNENPEIITMHRLHSKLSPKDRERFMKLLRIQFDEDFPEDDDDV